MNGAKHSGGRFHGTRCFIVGGKLAEAMVRRFESEGATVVHRPDSPSDGRAAHGMIESAFREMDGLELMVTSPYFRDDQSFVEVTDETWDRTLSENLRAPFLLCREAARMMARSGGGVIVNVGSFPTQRDAQGASAFAAARAAVELLTSGVALDLAPMNVRVCGVATPDDRESPIADEDVAGAVAFCASHEASYVLGSTLYLDASVPFRA